MGRIATLDAGEHQSIMVHEDWSNDLSGRGGPELVLGFRPTPFVTLGAGDGGAAPLAM